MNLKGKKFENSRLDMEIYVYDIDGKEWFIGKDVAKILGYSEKSKPLIKWGESGAIVWEENKKKIYVKTLENTGKCVGDTSKNINNNIVFVNESGLYQLIFGSTFTKAREFQKWVFEEVLPSLRKNNFYVDDENITESQLDKLKDFLFDIGKVSLGRVSEKLFGNKQELKNRLVNLGWINYENCTFKQQRFKTSRGELYDLFVCNMSGVYENGETKHQLQVSITNAGYVWLKDKFLQEPNFGL